MGNKLCIRRRRGASGVMKPTTNALLLRCARHNRQRYSHVRYGCNLSLRQRKHFTQTYKWRIFKITLTEWSRFALLIVISILALVNAEAYVISYDCCTRCSDLSQALNGSCNCGEHVPAHWEAQGIPACQSYSTGGSGDAVCRCQHCNNLLATTTTRLRRIHVVRQIGLGCGDTNSGFTRWKREHAHDNAWLRRV